MGRLAEVNQSTKIIINLFDGRTDKFPRFRIYNSSGVEQTSAPFNSPIDPGHDVGGLYRAVFTPNIEGEFSITKKVYNEVGRTTLDKKYDEITEDISIRSVDQDLATLISRLTSGRASNLDNLDALISSRSTQSSVNTIDGIVDAILIDTDVTIPALIDAVQTIVNAILVDTDATIPNLIAALNDPSVSQIADGVWDEARAGHAGVGTFGEFIDASIGSRASQVSVNGIQNNTNFVAIFPSIIEKPDSGSVNIKAFVRLFDTSGNPEDPDSNSITIRTELVDGTIIIATTAMTRTGVGLYEFTGSIDSNAVLGLRYIFFEYTENSISFNQVRQAAIVKTADIHEQILSEVQAIGVATDPDVIADRVWDEQKAAHNNAGSFGSLLDDKVSLAEKESDAAIRAISFAKEVTLNAHNVSAAKDSTVAKEGTLNGKASQISVDSLQAIINAIKAKTDSMVFDGDKIRATALVVLDKINYTLTTADKADIVDKVWDELIAGHLAAGSTGKTLSDAQAATDPLVIADAVWDESASAHGAPLSMGGKLNESRNFSDQNRIKNDTLLTRLTAGRAGNLDNIDATITSRQSEANALGRFNDLTADIANVVTVLNGIAGDVSGSDPDNLSILQLLNSGTFGLAQLRIQLDAKSTLAQLATVLGDLVTIKGNQADGATGFAALRTQLDAANAQLTDGNHGLAKLRTELDGKATVSEFSSVPTALQIADKVWDELTSDPRAAGSYGLLVKTNLDVKITTRATTTDLATVDTIVDDIKALLENGTFGLNALLDEINVNEVKIDANGVAIADVDSDLAAARAAILAAIALIVNGTPTIIAALDEIKGAGFVEATDALKAISAKLAAGTATIGNQTSILTKLNEMHGSTPAVSDTIKDTKVKVEQNLSEIQNNNTQIRDDVATVDGKVDSNSTEIAAVKARLDDVNFGLSKAKADRDSGKADILAGQGTQNSKLDTIENKVDTVDGKVVSSEATILAAISALDVSLINTNVQGIIALLQDGTNGLSAIKNAVIQVKNQEAANSSQIVGDINSLDTKVDTLNGLLIAIQGAGFTSSESLVAIKTAVLAVSTEHTDQALESSLQLVLTELNKIKDGDTATFDGSTDSLTQIAKQGSQLQGFEGGEA